MSRKNHAMIDGRLLKTDKCFSDLKQSQVEKISGWMREEYISCAEKHGSKPTKKEIFDIADKVYEKIEKADIWIPWRNSQIPSKKTKQVL